MLREGALNRRRCRFKEKERTIFNQRQREPSRQQNRKQRPRVMSVRRMRLHNRGAHPFRGIFHHGLRRMQIVGRRNYREQENHSASHTAQGLGIGAGHDPRERTPASNCKRPECSDSKCCPNQIE